MMDVSKPTPVTDLDIAFPAHVIGRLLPEMEDIPDKYKHPGEGDGIPYIKFQQKWFYQGLKSEDLPTAKDGINLEHAIRHLQAVQGSFEPKHEHKEAGVAYLASLWLDLP